MSKTAIYPVLSTSATYLTNKHDIAAAVLAFFIYNPGATSSSHPGMEISFRTIASELGHSPDLICERLSNILPAVIQRYFPDYEVSAEFTTSAYDETDDDGKYAITFDLRYVDNTTGTVIPTILSCMINVEDDDNVTLNFLT